MTAQADLLLIGGKFTTLDRSNPRADAALTRGPYTVVDKTQTPASGDKHDYISMGPYWWPDPAQPTGEPYIRRDGEVNPERNTNAFDAVRMDSMASASRKPNGP